tara:strand:- start:281 stop:463 length:183 start_codon:yes stop_codon:yes gene_type:complete
MAVKENKETKSTKTKPKAVTSNQSSIMTRLEVVEKMLVVTRDELKEVTNIVEKLKTRMGL